MNQIAHKELLRKVKNIKIEGMLIYRNDELLFEYVKNKKIKEKPAKVYSITKSIVSLLIGILVDKGMIEDIHTPIHHYFPEVKEYGEKKEDITLYHLLTMTSGLKEGPFSGANNWVSFILKQPLIFEPGEEFQYSNGCSHLLSAIVEKVSGMPTAVFAEKHLFGPLSINQYTWVADPQGIHGGGFSLSVNVEDMVKVGKLYFQKGMYKGKQIVSTEWIERAQKGNKVVEISENGIYKYGYQLWTFEGNDKMPVSYFYANGIFGQYIFIVPQLQIVAVVKSQLKGEEQTLPKIYFNDWLGDFLKNELQLES